MHCGSFAAGDDFDDAVQDKNPCMHNITPCDLSNMEYCSYIAPDLIQGDSNRCFGCNFMIEETAKWKNNSIHQCSLTVGCPMWIHDKCLKELTLGGRTSSKVQCRYHTEIYDRHQHPDECHSCNSVYDFHHQCQKVVTFLSDVFDR